MLDIACYRYAKLAVPVFLLFGSVPQPLPLATPLHEQATHVMNRMGYGGTPSELQAITSQDMLTNWIQDQIHSPLAPPPAALTNAVTALLGSTPVIPPVTSPAASPVSHNWRKDALARYRILMAAFQPQQLRERMTNFWQTLFNTANRDLVTFYLANQHSIGQAELAATYAQYREYEAFRSAALSTFKSVLETSIHSPPMRIYLDMHVNTSVAQPNENYARELLELHTFGPYDVAGNGEPNYSQQDIRNLASLLVGLQVETGVNSTHAAVENFPIDQPPAITLFAGRAPRINPVSIPSSVNSLQKIDMILSHIVEQNQTSDYICRRLIREFVGDETSTQNLLLACKAQWGMEGDIQAVLDVILSSAEFLDNPNHRRSMIESPFESAVSQIRNLGINPPTAASNQSTPYTHLFNSLEFMGQSLFEFPSPDGYPMDSFLQAGSHRARLRFRSALWLYPSEGQMQPFAQSFNPPLSLDNPATIPQTVLDHLYPNDYVSDDLMAAADILTRSVVTGNVTAWPAQSATGLDTRDNRFSAMMSYIAGMTQAYVK
ncbi:MAG: DUF1800 family protein [Planctomycetes bacterium]|nr:DUF1800 family protein [Planctomycetota bacterium]